MGMWQEFKEFALKGNALALAVGVIIGAAFGKIVDALVNDLIMPIVGIAGKADFSNYFIPLSSSVTATNLADARKQGGVLAYGDFISVAINFAIVAVALFILIKGINVLTRPDKNKPAEPPPPSPEVVLLTEIRDQLARRSAASDGCSGAARAGSELASGWPRPVDARREAGVDRSVKSRRRRGWRRRRTPSQRMCVSLRDDADQDLDLAARVAHPDQASLHVDGGEFRHDRPAPHAGAAAERDVWRRRSDCP